MSFNFASLKKNLQDLSSSAIQAANEAQLDQKLKNLSETVTSTTSQLPNFAAKTQRYVEEKIGRVTDISQLPSEFVELDNRVLRYKICYQSLLKVTSTFDNPSYDYPQHIRDSVNDFSNNVASKITDLSRATSTTEAQNILLSNNANLSQPKTLNFALSKASLQSCELLNKSSEDELVASALLEFSSSEAKIGEFRLQQDTMIQTRFNKKIRTMLESNFKDAGSSKGTVESCRLDYDIARSNLANNTQPEKDALLRVDMENKEDKFAQATEDAIVVFTRVLNNVKVIDLLKSFAQAQLDYHKKCIQVLSDLSFGDVDDDFGEENTVAATPEKPAVSAAAAAATTTTTGPAN
ncbi:related to Protein GVP36 [Saccharomycodes ludwigii]|uniref:Related to Protein GVP36 n=1 Tax=Saccharomycodes ludwigii TaxID=36035 RepID=A0A376B5F8_9ASCO|nr:hypothetical protein SCDLUD_000369 [Saccharomycodes ludwigii]KAH3902780.1 hypothetical protein SCDLUD_000369 [Saccharomycodes ludwigii]SSD59893.1 related to Protein GVP36 [Saccharomycodes ludwigii]